MTGTVQDQTLRSRRSVGAASQILFVAVLGAAVGFGNWARTQTFTATAQGSSVVSALEPPMRVFSDISGTIAAHEIKAGLRVAEGQFLFSVRNVTEDAEKQAAAPAPKALRAEIARLAAEAEGRRSITFPADIVNGTEAKAESAVFEERQAALVRQQRALRDSVRQAQLDVAEQKASAEQAARARDLTRKELDILGPLVDRGISPKLEFLGVQQRVQELEAQRERALLAVPRLEASIEEFERKIKETVKEFRNSAKRRLSEKRRELATKTRPVVTKKRKVESKDMRAPIDGEILNAAAPGAVVGEGQTVAVIAPPVVARFIEGRVPKDAGVTLRQNQKVVVSFGHGQNLGRVDAVIAKISSASENSGDGGETWAVTLRVDAGSPGFEKLAKVRDTVRITATAEQPILDYLWHRVTAASGGRIVERLTGK